MAEEADEKIDFRTLEGCLAREFKIADDKRSTFASRLKNFERLGLLQETVPQQGKARTYRSSQLFSFALALEMTALGLKPEMVVRLILANEYVITEGIYRALDLGTQLADASPINRVKSQFIVFDPRSLSQLQVREGLTPTMSEFRGMLTLNESQIVRYLGALTSRRKRRMSLINLSSLLESTSYNLDSVAAGIPLNYEVWYSNHFPLNLDSVRKVESIEAPERYEYNYFLVLKDWLHDAPQEKQFDAIKELTQFSTEKVYAFFKRLDSEDANVDPQA